MRRAFVLIALAVCVMPIVSSAQAPAGKSLDIYFIDTEGGQATLYMSPADKRCSWTPATRASGT